MSKRLVSSLAFVLLALPARSQSLNIDFGPSGSPFGPPPATYGAAALSPGYWNSVGSVSASNLVATDGSPTIVALSTAALPTNAFFAGDEPNTSGGDEALLDDYHRPDDFTVSWTFTGLAPGQYDVYTIIVGFQIALWLNVDVPGSADPAQNVYGTWSGAFVQGTNFAKHHTTVTNGTLRIDVAVVGINDYAYLNGIQLVKDGEVVVGIPQCFGDGSGASCPCANSGATAHGCRNSQVASGALLDASGTTSPDTVVLVSTGELPSSLSIFLQGNATISPTPFGDGLRCAGGILKRLYTANASGGAISRPGPGDPSITARSAALGDPIPPGQRRYYQTYYRDGSPSFCPLPTGNSFNATNALRITW